MPTQDPKQPWEQKLHDAGTRVEEDLRKVVKYLNDEVIPDIRRSGSEALRAAAIELHRLATKMEDSKKNPPPPAGAPRP